MSRINEKVLASYFSDKIGYRDNNLYDGNYWYAELSKDPFHKPLDFSALGKLPYKYKLDVTYKGKTIRAMKGDVGAGGSHYPKIDLHYKLAKDLNFIHAGLDYVHIKSA